MPRRRFSDVARPDWCVVLTGSAADARVVAEYACGSAGDHAACTVGAKHFRGDKPRACARDAPFDIIVEATGQTEYRDDRKND